MCLSEFYYTNEASNSNQSIPMKKNKFLPPQHVVYMHSVTCPPRGV